MNINLKNPILLSTFITIFLLLTGLLKKTEHQSIISLLSPSKITCVDGFLCNSPTKISSGKYYSSNFKIENIYENVNKYSGKGMINILIPTNIVEAYYPGKKFTESNQKSNFIFEEGGFYKINGQFSNNIFIVKECIVSYWDKNIFSFFYKLRANLRIHFKRLMYSWGGAGGLFLALLSSSKEYTEIQLAENFRRAGLSHILALSGMHLSLLSKLASFIGNKTKRIRFSYLIRLFAISIFVFFAGFSPSLLRAFVSFIILYIYSLCNVKKISLLEVLCLTFFIQININSSVINNAGFILSYSALFGILIIANFIKKLLCKLFPSFITNSFSSSIAAQFFTFPFSIKIFGSFAPIGVISTFFVSPLITIFLYLGLILFLLSIIFPFLNTVSGIFINFLYNIISFIVNLFAMIPQISINKG